jgi:hypothetical protein
MNPVASQAAFTVSGRDVLWTDVIGHARQTGAWDALLRQVADGMALTGDASPEALKEASNDFRYARGLIAGDELREWLDRWGLTVADWRDHIRRTLLLETHAAPMAELPDEDHLVFSVALWASAVCFGTLEVVAEELAGLLAAGEWIADRYGETISPQDVRGVLETRLVTDEAMKAQLQSRALDWIRIESSVLTFGSQDAAREAMSLLRHDGLRPDEVAAIAHAHHEHRTEHLIDVEDDRRAVLLGAQEGDVLGPFPTEDSVRVMVVQRKQTPTLDDSQFHGLATHALVERAIRRETDERVVWRGGD